MVIFGSIIRAVQGILEGHKMLPLRYPIKPVPASRPRVTRWGTYYGKNYKAWRASAEKHLTTITGTVDGPLFVITTVISPRPKTTKRFWPRGDNDNFEKAAWDSISSSEHLWDDDDQIVGNLTFKRFSEPDEEPGVLMEIYEL